MLAHPGNRTAAASASHLSRSVFYQRIALIEDLLGVDLDDGETQTALHLALLCAAPPGGRRFGPPDQPATYTFRRVSRTVHTVRMPASSRTTEPGRSSIEGSAGSTNSTVAAPDEHDEHLVDLDVAHRAGGHLPHADPSSRRSR